MFHLIALLFWAAWQPIQEMEDCNNAIDDDGDGLIDINDPDCACRIIEPKSLIPNPSFEDMECCPQSRGSLHCATTWIQASEATTDYLHTCGWMGWPNLEPPLPFPDGEACIGFRDGRFGEENPNPNWKEYTGACLTEPLRQGNTYRFEFYVGFTKLDHSPPLTMGFFGSNSCNNLPFGKDQPDFGCPTNDVGWHQLDAEYVFGSNTWKKYAFEVSPTTDIYAIAIGPNCTQRFQGPNPYYFLDDLLLADIREFEFVISASENSCADNFSLSLPARDSLRYQWYRDGIALLGETNATLREGIEDGKYQVLIEGTEFCRLTKPFHFQQTVFETAVQMPLCPDASLDFYGNVLTTPGVYFDTLTSSLGCDSIIMLSLHAAEHYEVDQTERIFPGESLHVGHRTFSEPTQEPVLLSSSSGCDSLVMLNLEYYQVFIPNGFTPNGDGINDVFKVQAGPDLISVDRISIMNRWGGFVYHSSLDSDASPQWNGTSMGAMVEPGSYIYMIDVTMIDGIQRTLSGSLQLIY